MRDPVIYRVIRGTVNPDNDFIETKMNNFLEIVPSNCRQLIGGICVDNEGNAYQAVIFDKDYEGFIK